MNKFKKGEMVWVYNNPGSFEILEILDKPKVSGITIFGTQLWYVLQNIDNNKIWQTNEKCLIKISAPYCKMWRDLCLE